MSPKDVWIGDQCILVLGASLPPLVALLVLITVFLSPLLPIPLLYLSYRLCVYTFQLIHITCESHAYRLKTSTDT